MLVEALAQLFGTLLKTLIEWESTGVCRGISRAKCKSWGAVFKVSNVEFVNEVCEQGTVDEG